MRSSEELNKRQHSKEQMQRRKEAFRREIMEEEALRINGRSQLEQEILEEEQRQRTQRQASASTSETGTATSPSEGSQTQAQTQKQPNEPSSKQASPPPQAQAPPPTLSYKDQLNQEPDPISLEQFSQEVELDTVQEDRSADEQPINTKNTNADSINNNNSSRYHLAANTSSEYDPTYSERMTSDATFTNSERLMSDFTEEENLRRFGPLTVHSTTDPPKVGQPSPARTEAAMLFDEERPILRRRRPTLTDDELAAIPRLVHRNMPFHQSRQDIAVINSTVNKNVKLQWILSHDWYHVILRWPTAFSVMILLTIWTVNIIIFAAIYRRLDTPNSDCGLGAEGEVISFNSAFAFSLETCTTVGYGLPNSTNGFFEAECGRLQIVIYFQMVWSMLFNAFLFAFLFARLARCEQRGVQMLFSNKAIIEYRDGKWYMHVRVYDLDSAQPVVEAHVRMYCVSWRDYENQTKEFIQPHLLHAMRIAQPDDTQGANMFTSIPANVTHHIDAFSPLCPWDIRKRANIMRGQSIPLRELDGATGATTGVACPVCGEQFGTLELLEKHINYQKIVEEQEGYPHVGTHLDPSIIMPRHTKPLELTEDNIQEQLMDKEIMCVVEGIEPMVSGTFQALQSYKLKDIDFGGRFAPCMSQKNGKIFVDVDKFHQVLPPHDNSCHHYKSRRKMSDKSKLLE